MQNFVNEAVLGKSISQESFLTYFQEILEGTPIIKFVLFVGAVAFAGFYTIAFVNEIRHL